MALFSRPSYALLSKKDSEFWKQKISRPKRTRRSIYGAWQLLWCFSSTVLAGITIAVNASKGDRLLKSLFTCSQSHNPTFPALFFFLVYCPISFHQSTVSQLNNHRMLLFTNLPFSINLWLTCKFITFFTR